MSENDVEDEYLAKYGYEELQPDWKNAPTFDELKRDYDEALPYHREYLDKLDKWQLAMDGGKEINTIPKKSKIRVKVIRKHAEWKYASLEGPLLSSEDMFRVSPTTYADVASARQNQDVLNFQWRTQIDRVGLIGDMVRSFVDEGTAIVKTGWEFEEEEYMEEIKTPIYASPEESFMLIQEKVKNGLISPEQGEALVLSGMPIPNGEKIVKRKAYKTIKNQPMYEVCDNSSVIIDPTCRGNIKEAMFAIHEYETDFSILKKDEYKKRTHLDEEGKEIMIEEVGFYRNLNMLQKSNRAETQVYNETDTERESYNRTQFTFKDKARKKLTVYEYWGYWDIEKNGTLTPIIATWVDNILIRLEENPYPFKEIPFSLAKYMPIKNETHGEPDTELLADNQDIISKMTRAAHDIVSDQAVGQEFIDEQFFSSPASKEAYKKGNTVYFTSGKDPRTSMHRRKVDPVPAAVFDMIAYNKQEAEEFTAINKSPGSSNKSEINRGLGGMVTPLDASSKREESILGRMAQHLFKDLARKTIAMNQAWLDEEFVISVTDEEFVEMKREDLAGNFDLKIAISTPEKDEDKASKLNLLMQTNAASMDPVLSKKIYTKIATLWKMPELAKDIESFEPQPDPVQQELKQIQIDNEKLINQKLQMEVLKLAKDIESEDSKINERDSRVAQNLVAEAHQMEATAKENEADAIEALAKSRKLDAETEFIMEQIDEKKLDFVRKADGTEAAEELDKKKIDSQHKQELEVLKSENKMLEEQHKPETPTRPGLPRGDYGKNPKQPINTSALIEKELGV